MTRGRHRLGVFVLVLVLVASLAVAPTVAQWPSHAGGPDNTAANPTSNGYGDGSAGTFATPGGDIASEPAVTDDGVFVVANDTVVGYTDVGNWTTDLGATSYATPAVTDARAFVPAGDMLYALDTDTGAVVWSATLDGQVLGSATVADGTVYVGTQNGTLVAYSAVGAKQWQYDTGAPFGTATPTVAGDTVYAGTADGRLHAVAAANGSEQWTKMITEGDSARLTTPVAGDETLYLADANGRVIAVGADGTQQWSVDLDETVAWEPTLLSEQVVVATTAGTVSALATADGAPIWTTEVPAAGTIGPQLSSTDGTVLVGTDCGSVHALSATDGGQQWAAGVDGTLVTAVAVGTETGYAGTDSGVMVAVGKTVSGSTGGVSCGQEDDDSSDPAPPPGGIPPNEVQTENGDDGGIEDTETDDGGDSATSTETVSAPPVETTDGNGGQESTDSTAIVTSTATPTATTTDVTAAGGAGQQPETTQTTTGSGPGFGALVVIVALLAVALLARRR